MSKEMESAMVAMMTQMSHQTDVLLAITEMVAGVSAGLEKQGNATAQIMARQKQRMKIMREQLDRMKEEK